MATAWAAGERTVPVWLLVPESTGLPGPLEKTLHDLLAQPGTAVQLLGKGEPDLACFPGLDGKSEPPIILAESIPPGDPLLLELLSLGVGVVTARRDPEREHWVDLANRFPLVLVPSRADPETLEVALATAAAAARRHLTAMREAEQLRRRLEDRILIERAKGVLTRHLKIAEDQAYRRLRTLARRQRRPMRDVARALLDTQSLLENQVELLGLEEGTVQ